MRVNAEKVYYVLILIVLLTDFPNQIKLVMKCKTKGIRVWIMYQIKARYI